MDFVDGTDVPGSTISVDIEEDMIAKADGKGHLLWRAERGRAGTCRALETKFSDESQPQVAVFSFR